jgi:hypothetical protein
MRVAVRHCARVAVIAAVAATSFALRPASGDELKLKDGSKISGTIVGFDDNSFKVKTNYGFAVVQKDQVVSIAITPAAKTEDPEKKAEPAAEKAPPPAPPKPTKPETASATPSAKSSSPPNAHSGSATTTANADQPAAAPTPAPKKTDAPTNVKANANAPGVNPAPGAGLSSVAASAPSPAIASATAAPSAPAPPPKPVAPEPIRESVNGNTYTNETYGFQMYKPPDWEVIASASTLMPGAIAAMGTGDQTTYLLVGQGPAGKTIASDEDQADRRLRGIMENFRPLDLQHVTVSGAPAIERRFRGSVDQHD